MVSFKVSSLLFSIEGSGNYYNALVKYFKDKAINESDIISDLSIYVTDKVPNDFKPTRFSLSESISFCENYYMIKKKTFKYIVRNLFDVKKPTEVYLIPSDNILSAKYFLRSLFSNQVGNHNKYDRFVIDTANYSCLWYIFAITLLKKGCAFIHSGMMSVNDHGFCLSGTSGCGKTSTMINMVSEHGYDYISEDFGIMDSNGYLYNMPKKCAIYQSDAKWGNPYITKALSVVPFFKRLEWKIKKSMGRNPVYYFSPIELFGDKIGDNKKIKMIYYLVRTNNGKSIYNNIISKEELAERATISSFRELKELYDILTNIRAVGGEKYYNMYPSMKELMDKHKKIILSGLNNVKCYEIMIPLKIDPYEIAQIIKYNYESSK